MVIREKKCNSKVSELSQDRETLAACCQDSVTMLIFACGVILVEENSAILSHQSFTFHYSCAFLW